MRIAFFLGCTIPARARNYEQSVRAIAPRLGIELVDVEEFACCGFPMATVHTETAMAMASRNLSIAQERHLSICTLCSSCSGALREASHRLEEDHDRRERINRMLSRIGRRYDGHTEVKHFVRILWEDVGVDRIRGQCRRPLEGLRLAAHYGCHYLKPSEVHGGFDHVEAPSTIDAIIEATGAQPVDYPTKKLCCGGSVLGADKQTALEMAARKLIELRQLEVDALVVICPFCGVMYDANQKVMEKTMGLSLEMPVLYLPQVIGLAFGMDDKELGLRTHAIKPTTILERL
jgi:heterodisulfide reductase subunit B